MKKVVIIFSSILFIVVLSGKQAFSQSQQAGDEVAAKKLKKYAKFKLIRTSNDSLLLQKYIDLYVHNGGELYMIMMQQKYILKKVKDTLFELHLADADESQEGDHPLWNDFLYCPIGKHNGTINVINGEGDKVQEWHYHNEKKEGIVYWYDADKKVSNKFVYKQDVLQQK